MTLNYTFYILNSTLCVTSHLCTFVIFYLCSFVVVAFRIANDFIFARDNSLGLHKPKLENANVSPK